ncbi:apolipoprotein R-like [Castor canadensis]|uniref:Apolipoprotein R-like n=1 Tax=Castor canadensis TaxID=51338 RepID=A0AC58KHY2_CASCN
MRLVPGSGSLSLCLLGVLIFLLQASILLGCIYYPKIAHGHATDISGFLSFTTVVKYECMEGYALVGPATVSCRSSQWLSPPPQCKALCLKPKIPNGKLSVETNHYVNPETITIQCNPGYRMVGSQNISCSENKSWSPAVPKCEMEVPEDCDIVLAGKNLLQCLPSPRDSKVALELHKLSLQIEKLKQDRDKRKII